MGSNWILNELSNGFQKLICLRLSGQPADDLIEGTLLGWVEAIGARWHEERDVPRFQEAFRFLMRTSTQWPAPADFLDALPPVAKDPYRAPALIADEASQRRGMRACNEILRKLGVPVAEETP